MKIVHIASEFAPFCKLGGLADVVSGLGKAHTHLGHDVHVILPFYDCISRSQLGAEKIVDFQVKEHNITHPGSVFFKQEGSIRLYLLDLPHPDSYFERGYIYGGKDESLRFLYFCKAALSFIHVFFEENIDILHLHDWVSAGCLLIMESCFPQLKKKIKKSVLTIHNIQHQGKLKKESLNLLGNSGDHLLHDPQFQDRFDSSMINILRSGIQLATTVTVVSPSYAQEIETEEHGYGLEQTVIANKHKIIGIINGIDTHYWNMETDPFIFERGNHSYQLDDWLSLKQKNKERLFHRLNLLEGSGPVVCSITRLVHQKGPLLIKQALEFTKNHGGVFILLGAAIQSDIEHEFLQLAKHYQNHPHIYIHYGFDEMLAHQTYAAADVLIVPSLFEPCGLTQMIGMRYGDVPIVRKTGGLKDTVHDVQDEQILAQLRNGFCFDQYNWEEFEASLKRCFTIFKNKTEWKHLVANALSCDFSWEKSAKKYLNIYLS
ncbi:MAG: glycogen/starch synthase [Chlamydiales bacterium]|nr:glycogen/starch synthase [Chlamydiales bacterium]